MGVAMVHALLVDLELALLLRLHALDPVLERLEVEDLLLQRVFRQRHAARFEFLPLLLVFGDQRGQSVLRFT